MKTPILGSHPSLQRIVEAVGLGDKMVSRLSFSFGVDDAAEVTATYFLDEERAGPLAEAIKTIGLCIADDPAPALSPAGGETS